MADQNIYNNLPDEQKGENVQEPASAETAPNESPENASSTSEVLSDSVVENAAEPQPSAAATETAAQDAWPQQQTYQPQQNPYSSQGTYYSYSPNSNNYGQQYYQQSGYYNQNPQPPKKNRGGKIALLVIGIVVGVIAFSAIGYWAITEVSDIFTDRFGISSNSSTTSESEDEGESGILDSIIINSKPEGADEYSVNSDGTMTAASVIKKVRPSIVGIVQYVNSNMGIPTVNGEGSGIIISEDGYIITNAHVVEGASMITVVLDTEEECRATLVGLDTQSDLAVIKIDASGLTAAELGDSSKTVLGESVIAIGNPGGLELAGSCTGGMVSGLDRTISSDSTGYAMTYIQTDAAINPGNSGGALVNMYGQVIGINSAKIVSEGYEGLGFAIPVNEALPIVKDLQQYGYVKNRAKIGIGFQLISETVAQYYNYSIPAGLLVTTIDEDCDIATKDVEINDIITKIDGKEITSATVVYSVLQDKKPGDTVTLTVYRMGTRATTSKTFEVTVVLSEDKGTE